MYNQQMHQEGNFPVVVLNQMSGFSWKTLEVRFSWLI